MGGFQEVLLNHPCASFKKMLLGVVDPLLANCQSLNSGIIDGGAGGQFPPKNGQTLKKPTFLKFKYLNFVFSWIIYIFFAEHKLYIFSCFPNNTLCTKLFANTKRAIFQGDD